VLAHLGDTELLIEGVVLPIAVSGGSARSYVPSAFTAVTTDRFDVFPS
jgi:hypothetical protein